MTEQRSQQDPAVETDEARAARELQERIEATRRAVRMSGYSECGYRRPVDHQETPAELRRM